MLHAPSINSLLSCKHPRTACTYLNHQCIYAAQTKAVRILAAFTFTGLPLPEFCCFLTGITTQKKQPEMPSFNLRVTKMWKSQGCMVKVETRAWLRHRSCKMILEKWGTSVPRPNFRLGLDIRLKFVFCPLTAACFQYKERQKHSVTLADFVSLVFIAYEIKLEMEKSLLLLFFFSSHQISFSDFTEYYELGETWDKDKYRISVLTLVNFQCCCMTFKTLTNQRN